MVELKTAESGKKAIKQMWLLILSSLMSITLVILVSAWQLNNISNLRAKLQSENDSLVKGNLRLVTLSNDSVSSLKDQLNPKINHIDRNQQNYNLLNEHIESLKFSNLPELNNVLLNLASINKNYQEIFKKAKDWRLDYETFSDDLDQSITLNKIRESIAKIRALLDVIEGQQRLSAALMLREWKKSSVSDKLKITEKVLLEKQDSFSTSTRNIRSEIFELNLLTWELVDQQEVDFLADIKDNRFKLSIVRLFNAIDNANFSLESKLGLSNFSIELANALFGEGYIIDTEHQEIKLGTLGLFNLQRKNILSNNERAKILVEIENLSRLSSAEIDSITKITNKYVNARVDLIQGSLSNGIKYILVLGVLFALIFSFLAYSISISIGRHIRQLSKAIDLAQAADRAKSQFLANMSHELRTPLNGIIGMTALTLTSQLDVEQRESLELVKSSADSLLSLINDILDFSKIESGKFSLSPIVFNPNDLIKTTVKLLSFQAEQKSIELILEGKELPVLLHGDPERLRQILVNLIGNSIKFTPNGGGVILQYKCDLLTNSRAELAFSISDTGIGIPQEKQTAIFEPFTQADGSTTRNFGGTGLGLTITKQLIELMNGRIWLNSVAGRGTTFYFVVNLEVASAAMLETKQKIENSEQKVQLEKKDLSILVAEDNLVNQKLVTRILEKNGYKVQVVSNGKEAIEQLNSSQNFDLVLMDLQMPVMGGYEASQLIRQGQAHYSKIPIIGLTAHVMPEDREMCLNIGMNDFVTKPIKPDLLFEAIRKVSAS